MARSTTTAPTVGAFAAELTAMGFDPAERLPGWTFIRGPATPGLLGLADLDNWTITIYVRSEMPIPVARVLAHEIGHALDYTCNSGQERLDWLEARGRVGEAWRPTVDGARDLATGAGDFAESFAVLLLGGRSRSDWGQPTATQLELLGYLTSVDSCGAA